MTTKHTPAPWRIVENDDEDFRGFIKIAGGAHGQAVYDVAYVDVVFEDVTQEANAKLIASAPDLLAALHAAKHYIDNDAALQQVFAAIELAGEKP